MEVLGLLRAGKYTRKIIGQSESFFLCPLLFYSLFRDDINYFRSVPKKHVIHKLEMNTHSSCADIYA